ncbi:MAG: hypothetical protein QG585_110 [Patescibacteria group bacterium]|jgi:four helix bundle protein|nr:hypothetical protein [Patescibacteria group bacterium]
MSDEKNTTKDYKQLIVWQKSIELVEKIYEITKKFPPSENFCLTNQIRRSAISIPSNIAEGAQRTTRKDFANFLRIAIGSCAELETQLIISLKLGYIDNALYNLNVEKITEILKMLRSLWSKIIK